MKKASGSTITVYIFSGSKVIAEYDNGAAVGSPSREYIYSGSSLLAKIDSSGTKYYHQDHLSNRVVTDSSGNTLEQLGHYPFGESWYNATNDKLLFTSYERDAESGNDYAMMRYGVNRLARFSSPDPLSGSVGAPQSFNRYTYTLNDPIDMIDPWGLFQLVPSGCVANYPQAGGPAQLDCGYGFDGGGTGSGLPLIYRPGAGSGGGGGGGGVGTVVDKMKQIKEACDKARASGGGQIAFAGGVLSFDSAGGLTAASADLGHGIGFASVQSAGRDDAGRASVIFSFSQPYSVDGARIDSVLFSGSTPPPMGFGQAGAFTAATGTVGVLGGAPAEFLILRSLNRSDKARGIANQVASLLGSPCEGILADLALLGKF